MKPDLKVLAPKRQGLRLAALVFGAGETGSAAALLFQFLQAGGRWEQLLAGYPLTYQSNRGSGAAKVMATVLLGVLSGHWRYARINAVRGDGINPGLLGVEGTVCEDVVRLAMRRMGGGQAGSGSRGSWLIALARR